MLEKERKFGLCFGWAMVAMLGLWLLYLLMPESWLKAYNIIGAVPVLLLTAYYIYNKKLTGPIELKLLLIWGAWLVLTRVVNGDISFSRDRDFVLHNMLSCLFFAAGFWLCGKERERVVNALCLMYGGFFSLVAMLGILAALTGAYLHVSFEDIWISLRTEGSALKYVSFLNAHRLTAATRFFPAWIMMLWLFVREKGWLKRLVLGCCVLAIHMAVALCHSRTLQIVMALCYGMLAMLLVLKYLQKRTWLLRICCMVKYGGSAADCIQEF